MVQVPEVQEPEVMMASKSLNTAHAGTVELARKIVLCSKGSQHKYLDT